MITTLSPPFVFAGLQDICFRYELLPRLIVQDVQACGFFEVEKSKVAVFVVLRRDKTLRPY